MYDKKPPVDKLDHVSFEAVCWYLPAMTWKLCDIIELGFKEDI